MTGGKALAAGSVILGLLGGVWWHGHRAGVQDCAARQRAAYQASELRLIREADALSRLAYQVTEEREALARRAEEMEHAARLDAGSCRTPTSDSLRRLEYRWRGDRAD